MKIYILFSALILITNCVGYKETYNAHMKTAEEQIKSYRDTEIAKIEAWKIVEKQKALMIGNLLGTKNSPFMSVKSSLSVGDKYEPDGPDKLQLVGILKTGKMPDISVSDPMESFVKYLILSEYLKSNRMPELNMTSNRVSGIRLNPPRNPATDILKISMPAIQLVSGIAAGGYAIGNLMKYAGNSQNINGSYNKNMDNSVNNAGMQMDNGIYGSYNTEKTTTTSVSTDDRDTITTESFNRKYDYDYDYESTVDIQNSLNTSEYDIDTDIDTDTRQYDIEIKKTYDYEFVPVINWRTAE